LLFHVNWVKCKAVPALREGELGTAAPDSRPPAAKFGPGIGARKRDVMVWPLPGMHSLSAIVAQ
jgi:hypothetical protein